MILPEDYSVQKFLQLSGYPKVKNRGKIYEAGCPICREGKSWRRKRRLYFVLKDNLICCHNCGWTGSPLKFIQQVEGLTYQQIKTESGDYDILPKDLEVQNKEQEVKAYTLPADSINLYDPQQVEFYKLNPIVQEVCKFATKRNLFNAANRPKSLWASLTDYVHKNRLIIPFYDDTNNIVFYQSRTVMDRDNFLPKYLSKSNGEKTIFNLNNIDIDLDKIFIFEGPIDACFVKNGVAVGGIQEGKSLFTAKQSSQLVPYNLFDKIWTLDSQWLDDTSRSKSRTLLEEGETVFIWPEEYGKKFKDFNEMAQALKINEIPYTFVLKHSYTGLNGTLMLNYIMP